MGVLTEDKLALLESAQKEGTIIGLDQVTGQTVDRLDIDELLFKEPDAFNIFLIALQILQKDENYTQKFSFFQVAGVHGLPRQLWDKDTGGIKLNISKPDDHGSGYCHHGHLGFGPWHRPYLAMLEQTIFYEMVKVADQFPADKKSKYYTAVRKWRLPFWDYFRPRGWAVSFQGIDLKTRKETGKTEFDYDCGIPDILTIPYVMIRTQEKDELEPQRNPLASFYFPKDAIPLADWETIRDRHNNVVNLDKTKTLRYPKVLEPQGIRDDKKDLEIRNRDEKRKDPIEVKDALNKSMNGIREQTLRIIFSMFKDAAYADWETISSSGQLRGATGSLEGIHDTYHVFIGGAGGHMGFVPTAAFDPIFWLHHCQIDRLFAIWQKIHSKSWFPTEEAKIQVLKDNEVWFNPDDPLLPLRTQVKGDGKWDYWTCDKSRETKTFGYNYPETSASSDVLELFKKHYEWSYRKEKTSENFGECPDEMLPEDLRHCQIYLFTEADFKKIEDMEKPKAEEHPVHALMSNAPLEMASLEITPIAIAQSTEKPIDPSDRAFTNGVPKISLESAQKEAVETQISHSWYIDMLVERMALNESFSIHFFLGDIDEDPLNYSFQATRAGTNAVFAASIQACDNCGRQDGQNKLVTNTTDITPMLLDFKKIDKFEDLTSANIVPFLKENLKWRVATAGGTKVDPRSIESLRLGVSARLVPIPHTAGEIFYQEFPEVIAHIVGQAS